MILENGADIDAQDNDGQTALMWTFDDRLLPTEFFHSLNTAEELLNMIQFLIERDADLTIEDKRGRTALERAERLEAPEIIRLLQDAEEERFNRN